MFAKDIDSLAAYPARSFSFFKVFSREMPVRHGALLKGGREGARGPEYSRELGTACRPVYPRKLS
jgi:hypothetical protein